MNNHKEIFSTLKKCNQIGKKLSKNGYYLLVSGMMIGYTFQDMDETEASSLSISFIENKLLDKLDALPYIGLIIPGNDLYQISQECEFNQFTIDKDNLYIEFTATETTDVSFNNDFKEVAIAQGFDANNIDIGLQSDFSNDIDLYELFINYKKTYKPKIQITTKSILCKIINDNNKILKKSNSIIKNISNGEFLGYKELSTEVFERILMATQPIELNIQIKNNGQYTLRVMKSIFTTATTKSMCELRIIRSGDFDYLIVEISTAGFVTCNIYKVINI